MPSGPHPHTGDSETHSLAGQAHTQSWSRRVSAPGHHGPDTWLRFVVCLPRLQGTNRPCPAKFRLLGTRAGAPLCASPGVGRPGWFPAPHSAWTPPWSPGGPGLEPPDWNWPGSNFLGLRAEEACPSRPSWATAVGLRRASPPRLPTRQGANPRSQTKGPSSRYGAVYRDANITPKFPQNKT